MIVLFFFEAVFNVSLSSSWSPSSPINVADDFILDPTSNMTIKFSTNPHSGVAPIAAGRHLSLQGD